MTLLLKQVFAFIKVLNSETGDRAIALGLTLGWILALGPTLSIQGILVLMAILIFRVQAGAAFIAAFFFKLVLFILAPLMDSLGGAVLELTALQPVWTALYQAPLVPWTRFHHSVVMGGLVLGVLGSLPVYRLSLFLIKNYRTQIRDRFAKTRFWKWVKATQLFQLYAKYDQARSALA